jgi:DNA-directed RNA polymerase subunit RPC12/RpoP
MTIELKCPHCGKELEADVTAETALKCSVCGGSIFISQQFMALRFLITYL